jgi:nucleoside-diphosphate-sugar epimerase
MMKILCLGSSGFVGSVLLDRFRQNNDWEVDGIGSSSLNLAKPESVEGLADRMDEGTTLIFCARTMSSKSPWERLKIDLEMVHNVADALAQKRVRKCLYFSTLAVYDDSVTQRDITEETGVLPQSPYGIAKFAGECMLAQVAAESGFPLVVFRPCKLYGPGDRNFEYGPSSFLRSALMGDPIKLYGDGSELRDHLFIEDLVQIVRHLVQSDEGGIYNLASGVSRTYQDMLSIIHAVVKKEFEVAHEGRTRPQVDQTVDVSHLKQVVPGLRLTSLEQGIRETFLDMEQRLPEETRH